MRKHHYTKSALVWHCPKCGLGNRDYVDLCDCGYNRAETISSPSSILAASGESRNRRDISYRSQRNQSESREAGQNIMLFGILWCIGGIAFIALTYKSAAGSGGIKYVVAWGAIVFGGIQFIRGLMRLHGE